MNDDAFSDGGYEAVYNKIRENGIEELGFQR